VDLSDNGCSVDLKRARCSSPLDFRWITYDMFGLLPE
jgi:hypothetical protein